MKISAVVLTKNEEENIRQCLKSLSFCDEVIVVDDFSEDKTVEIARKLGAIIYKRKLNGGFAVQRNFGLNKAKNEWVLYVDADERVTKALASEINDSLSNKVAGFYFERLDYIWESMLKHGEIGSIRLLRLAKKGTGKWRRKVHEVWDVKGQTRSLKNPLLHFPHQTLREFLNDININTSLHSRENALEGKVSTLPKIILWPAAKFFRNFFIKMGFLDGMAGFVVAVTMSFNSFLAWSKLWFLQKNLQERV